MTRITAKLLVATYDKKDMLPAAAVSKRASNQASRATASELLRTPFSRTSEKTLPRTSVNEARRAGTTLAWCPARTLSAYFPFPGTHIRHRRRSRKGKPVARRGAKPEDLSRRRGGRVAERSHLGALYGSRLAGSFPAVISIRVEKHRGFVTVRFRVTAPSIERVLEIAGEGARVVFPIDAEGFFAEEANTSTSEAAKRYVA